jgi:hypothetical protein
LITSSPTAQTSFALLPQTALSGVAMGLGKAVQKEPSQCRMLVPTAQMSSVLLPQIP